MSRLRKLLVWASLLFLFVPMTVQGDNEETTPQERPRVYLGPYNDRALNRYYYGHPGLAYTSYFPSPLGYVVPHVPGRSSVTFAVGSDGYRGASFSTTQALQGTQVLFSLDSRWEEGDAWYLPGYRFRRNVISPRLSWSNQNTSISVGVDIGDYKLTRKHRARTDQPRVERLAATPMLLGEADYGYETELESVNVVLSQRLGNLGELYLSASKDDFGNDSLSAGIHRRLYESRNGSGVWLPSLR